MEVVHDLDVEAAEVAQRLGLPLARAATPGPDPRFVSMITALVRERLDSGLAPAALGSPGCGSGDCCRLAAPAGRPGGPPGPPGGGVISGAS
jgi:ferrochelatase